MSGEESRLCSLNKFEQIKAWWKMPVETDEM